MFQKMQEQVAPRLTPEQKVAQEKMNREMEDDPYNLSLGNMLSAAVEPMASMASSGLTNTVAGYAGMAKGGLWNPVSRIFGGHPDDAADLIKKIQEYQYTPHGQGGQTALSGFALPYQAWHEHVSEPLGRRAMDVSQQQAGPGRKAGEAGVMPALKGTFEETMFDAIPQILGGELLGKAGMKGKIPVPSPRPVIANIADRVGAPGVAETMRQPKMPSKDVDLLNAEGVYGTPGQRANVSPKFLKRYVVSPLEELFSRRPLLGSPIRAGRELASWQHAWAQLNRARQAVGLKPLKPTQMQMHDAIRETDEAFHRQYEITLGKMKADMFETTTPTGGMSVGNKNWANFEAAVAKYKTEKYGWPGAAEHDLTPAEEDQILKGLGLDRNSPMIDPRSGQGSPPPTGFGGYPTSFASEVTAVMNDARIGNPPNARALTRQKLDYQTLENIERDLMELGSKPTRDSAGNWDHGGKLDGQAVKQIQRMLRAEKTNVVKGDTFTQQLEPYIRRLQTAFTNMLERQNSPELVAELRRLDLGYSQMRMVMDAATHGGAAAKAGFFTPAATMRAIEKRTRQKRGEDEGTKLLARGEAQGQDLAEAAQRVLGNRIPSSGTTEGLLAAGEAGADAITGGADPSGFSKWAATTLGPLAIMRSIYSPSWLQHLAKTSQRPYGTGIAPWMTGVGPTAAYATNQRRNEMDEQSKEMLRGFGIDPDTGSILPDPTLPTIQPR